jgi:hypothetical protein
MTTKGMRFTRKVLKPCKGIVMGNRRAAAVAFDPDDFARISALAQKQGIAFQEQVRRLCALGLAVVRT